MTNDSNNKRWYDFPPAVRWGMLIAWMVAIFSFSAQPNSAEVTEHVFGSLNLLARKSAHMAEYAVLYLLVRNAFRRGGLLELILCVFYAMTDEFHQIFVAGRSASLSDVMIDSSGAAIMWAIISLCKRVRK
jgi:VanZ family protein